MNAHSKEPGAPRPAFRDRADAGRMLALSLSRYSAEPDVVVLGLARGGVPVARQVADALGAPLGVVVARKISVPGIADVALGAIAEGSHRVVAESVASYLGVPSRIVDRLAATERVEVERLVATYRAGDALSDLRGSTVILVDDGLATGATMRAAIRSVRAKRPARVVAAVPVASRSSADDVRCEVDDLVVIVTPARFDTVSSSYESYACVSDTDVLTLLGRPERFLTADVRDISDRLGAALTRADGRAGDAERTIIIQTSDAMLPADLGVPQRPRSGNDTRRLDGVRGLAILAHGSGSSRNSYRNRYIAGRLRLSGYATMRVDLLTREEQQSDSVSLRLDVERMTTRLVAAWEWAEREGVPGAHRTTLIGTSTGAAAALATAARFPGRVCSVVARGGRIDLAAGVLPHVGAPVLVIVGGADRDALRRDAPAMERLPRGAVLIKVPRARNSFDEPGTLGVVGEHIVNWLDRWQPNPRWEWRWRA